MNNDPQSSSSTDIADPAKKTKFKQVAAAVAVVTTASIGVLYGIGFFNKKAPVTTAYAASKQAEPQSLAGPGALMDEQRSWRGVADQQFSNQDQRLAELEKKQALLVQQLAETKEKEDQKHKVESEKLPEQEPKPTAKLPASLKKVADGTLINPPPIDTNSRNGLDKKFFSQPGSQLPTKDEIQNSNPLRQMLTGDDGVKGPKISTVVVSKPSNSAMPPSTTQTIDKPQTGYPTESLQPKKRKVFVPASSLVSFRLLTGLNAPTGGQAQQNPLPITFEITDFAFLPNRARVDIKECIGLGSGTGDLSQERVIVRADTLSCVKNNGEAFELKIKGHLIDSDGRVGLRGTVVHKSGQLLSNGLYTGMLSGFGNILQMQSQTINQTPFGSTTTVDPGKAFSAGAGAGFSKSLDRLSQYYISMADKLLPVIEVSAAKTGELIFTKGFEMELLDEADNGSIDTYALESRNRETHKFH